LSARDAAIPEHLDRCWLSTADKRAKRMVGERIGLAAGTTGEVAAPDAAAPEPG
jgi:hypothetical protein